MKVIESYSPFDDGGRYHIETSPLICGANQWTVFYMITASVFKELITSNSLNMRSKVSGDP